MQDFVVRSPTSEADIALWSHFCGYRGFAHRPGDPHRFHARYLNDPKATYSHVLMACQGLAVVGSARLFDRVMSLSPTVAVSSSSRVVGVLGWGEVCSDPEQRGKGIVGGVLKELVVRMGALARDSAAGPQPHLIALLHCAPSVEGLYAKFGFSGALHVPYARVAIGRWEGATEGLPLDPLPPQGTPCTPSHPHTLRLVDFAGDWEALEALRGAQNERCGLVGWMVRGEAYWGQWVRNACKGRAGVLCSGSGAIVAYGYVRWREGAYRVMDWACQGGLEGGVALPFLLALTRDAVVMVDTTTPPPFTHSAGTPLGEGGQCTCVMPLALALDVMGNGEGGGGVVEEDALCDKGWMVRALDGAGELGEAAVATLREAAERKKFIVYQADNI